MSRRPPPFDGKLDRSIVLVGLMGAGKSTVGRRLARRLGLPFVDSDTEIEDAAGLSTGEVFQRFGERDFRDGERRVVARLAEGPVRVIATGGGAAGPAGGVDKSIPSKKAKAANEHEDGEQTPVKKSAVKKAAAKGKKAVKGVKVEVKSEEEENALESIEGSGGRAVTAGVMGDDQGGILP